MLMSANNISKDSFQELGSVQMCQWAPWVFTGLGTEGIALAMEVFSWWSSKNSNRLLPESFPCVAVQWECSNLSSFCYRKATRIVQQLSNGDWWSGKRSCVSLVPGMCVKLRRHPDCPQHPKAGHVPLCAAPGWFTEAQCKIVEGKHCREEEKHLGLIQGQWVSA